MLEAPAELIEDRLAARRIGRLGAHQADQLALPRRTGGAADRAFDERRAFRAHLFGERD